MEQNTKFKITYWQCYANSLLGGNWFRHEAVIIANSKQAAYKWLWSNLYRYQIGVISIDEITT